MYLEIFNWVETDRGYLTMLYNVGLMLVTGGVLGFLIEKVTDLISSAKSSGGQEAERNGR